MKSRILKSMAVILFVFIVSFFAMAESRAISESHGHSGVTAGHSCADMVRGSTAHGVSQSIDGGNSLRAGVPDGVLASESGIVSYIRNGGAAAGAVEYLVMLTGMSLFFFVFLFLLCGRSWSVVQSICMKFQGCVMRQIHILKLMDGKKRAFSYSAL